VTKRKWYAKPIYLLVALALVVSLGLVAIPMAGPVDASPNDWYVATSGNDTSGDGSEGNPWRHINYAIGQASANDTVNVATGTYDEIVIIDKENLAVQAGSKILASYFMASTFLVS